MDWFFFSSIQGLDPVEMVLLLSSALAEKKKENIYMSLYYGRTMIHNASLKIVSDAVEITTPCPNTILSVSSNKRYTGCNVGTS